MMHDSVTMHKIFSEWKHYIQTVSHSVWSGSAVQIVPSLIMLVPITVFEQITLTNMTFTGNSCVCAHVFMRVCRVCVWNVCAYLCVWMQETHHRQCVKVRSQPRVLVFPFQWVWDRISPLLSPLWRQASWPRDLRLLGPRLPSHSGKSGTADSCYVAQLLCMFWGCEFRSSSLSGQCCNCSALYWSFCIQQSHVLEYLLIKYTFLFFKNMHFMFLCDKILLF